MSDGGVTIGDIFKVRDEINQLEERLRVLKAKELRMIWAYQEENPDW